MPRNEINPLPQPVFEEGKVTADQTGFTVVHPSDKELYKAIKNLSEKDVVSFPASRGQPDDVYNLQDGWGARGSDVIKTIQSAGKIVFHAAGDTGASNEGKYGNEVRVCDQLTNDCRTANDANRPAFLFHLGDVVYDFGEAKYYYDQFYEPFRNYPAPIFAIPGNHDSFVVPNTPAGSTPLEVFMRNFCATQPTVTAEAASLHRTSMTQPGVYFALDAPFVRIIGLFSNSLEDPGVISSEISNKGKNWPSVPDFQLSFLEAQLQRIKKEKYPGALLIATHHPAFTYSPPNATYGSGGNHRGSWRMLRNIDEICEKVGVYPHAFLSGHAHNYQRFARCIRFGKKQYEVPFIVCGDSGHNVNLLVKGKAGQRAREPHFGVDVHYLEHNPAVKSTGLILKHYEDRNYGYLRITADKQRLRIGFQIVAPISGFVQSGVDMVTVDLATHTMVAN